METELVKVEAEALLEVADVNRNRLQAQVGVPAIQANSRAVVPLARRVAHACDYKAEWWGNEERKSGPPQKADPTGNLRVSLRTSRGRRGPAGGGRGASRR